MFHHFFSYIARTTFRYFYLFLLFSFFGLQEQQNPYPDKLFFLLINTRAGLLAGIGDPFVCLILRDFYVFYILRRILIRA